MPSTASRPCSHLMSASSVQIKLDQGAVADGGEERIVAGSLPCLGGHPMHVNFATECVLCVTSDLIEIILIDVTDHENIDVVGDLPGPAAVTGSPGSIDVGIVDAV